MEAWPCCFCRQTISQADPQVSPLRNRLCWRPCSQEANAKCIARGQDLNGTEVKDVINFSAFLATLSTFSTFWGEVSCLSYQMGQDAGLSYLCYR